MTEPAEPISGQTTIDKQLAATNGEPELDFATQVKDELGELRRAKYGWKLNEKTGKPEDEYKDIELLKDGKQLTLREALVDLAAHGDLGAGALVELDTDGKVIPAK